MIMVAVFGLWWVAFVIWFMGVNLLTYAGMRAAWRQVVEQEGYELSFFHYQNWDHDKGGELAFHPIRRTKRYLLRDDAARRRFRIWTASMVVFALLLTCFAPAIAPHIYMR